MKKFERKVRLMAFMKEHGRSISEIAKHTNVRFIRVARILEKYERGGYAFQRPQRGFQSACEVSALGLQ